MYQILISLFYLGQKIVLAMVVALTLLHTGQSSKLKDAKANSKYKIYCVSLSTQEITKLRSVLI